MGFLSFTLDWDQDCDAPEVRGRFRRETDDLFASGSPATMRKLDEHTLEVRFSDSSDHYYRFVAGTPTSARERMLAEYKARVALGLAPALADYRQFKVMSLTGFGSEHSYFGMRLPAELPQADAQQRLQAVRRVLRAVPVTLAYVARQLRTYPDLADFCNELTQFANSVREGKMDSTDQALAIYMQTQRYLQQLSGKSELGQHRNTRHQAHQQWYTKLSPGAKAAIVFGLGIVLGAVVLFILAKVASAQTRSQRRVASLWVRLLNPPRVTEPRRRPRAADTRGGSVIVPADRAHQQVPMPMPLSVSPPLASPRA